MEVDYTRMITRTLPHEPMLIGRRHFFYGVTKLLIENVVKDDTKFDL